MSEGMTAWSDLPDEIALEVFSHLDGESLSKAALVCKG